MCAFATDQSLCQDDQRQLEAAVAGELEALVAVCDRFEVPLLAAATRATGSVETAIALVEPALSAVCGELLEGQLAAHDWSRRALQLVADGVPQSGVSDATPPGSASTLSAIGALPRVARRRAVRDAVVQLPLPELTALLFFMANLWTQQHLRAHVITANGP